LGLNTPNKRGNNPEIELLEVRHMSRLKFFDLGLPKFVSKLVF
jgi:hypothetical protein